MDVHWVTSELSKFMAMMGWKAAWRSSRRTGKGGIGESKHAFAVKSLEEQKKLERRWFSQDT